MPTPGPPGQSWRAQLDLTAIADRELLDYAAELGHLAGRLMYPEHTNLILELARRLEKAGGAGDESSRESSTTPPAESA